MSKGKVIMSMNGTSVNLFERLVVSKRLKDEIRKFIEDDLEIAVNLESMLNSDVRQNVVHDLSMFFRELYEADVIDQFDVKCDKRNNTDKMAENGIVKLEIKYREWNCAKHTVLEYTIEHKPRTKKKSKGRIIL